MHENSQHQAGVAYASRSEGAQSTCGLGLIRGIIVLVGFLSRDGFQ